MTQEEKAQAYDEALNKAKAHINTKGIGEAVDLCYQLFPELAESGDENLKNKSGYYKDGKFWKASTLWNATKNKIPQRVSNRYILQECTWNIGNLQDFANEVKNVQETSLDYPIILDMNGNILDGAHRVVKAYLEGKDIDIVYLGDGEWPEPDYDEEKAVRENNDEKIKKSLIKFLTDIKEISESGRTTWAVRKEDAEMCKSFIAWLEKQKENPESADSIQSDCTSNAKCEDRWHKVSDSLPDSTREVLCKDAIGNYFIGRYYSEGVWEVSMYDDCDKSNEDNPPVVMWIDIPSEKQKEQNPVPFSCSHEKGQPGEKQDYSELNDLERAILRGFLAAGVENVPIGIIKDTASECVGFLALTESEPVEWSEEDEGELQNAIDALEFLGKKGVYRSESGYDAALQAASWLKSLSERFNLQRKVEWSEEDKKMLNHLIDKIQENLNIRMPDGYSFGISNDEKETFSSWLRCLPERFNLQPNQE